MQNYIENIQILIDKEGQTKIILYLDKKHEISRFCNIPDTSEKSIKKGLESIINSGINFKHLKYTYI